MLLRRLPVLFISLLVVALLLPDMSWGMPRGGRGAAVPAVGVVPAPPAPPDISNIIHFYEVLWRDVWGYWGSGKGDDIEQGIVHVMCRHSYSVHDDAASYFATNSATDVAGFIVSVLRVASPNLSNGKWVYEASFQEGIGYDKNNRLTGKVRVVLDAQGRLITAYPI